MQTSGDSYHKPRSSHTFSERPILVFWETTAACPLRCRHCRASALHTPLPGELTTAEGHRLVEEVAAMGPPRSVLVLTGGDCLSRPDLLPLTSHARALGLPVALSPSVSPNLTPTTMAPYRAFGVRSVSISLDGCLAVTHDGVRGIPGHLQRTIATIKWLTAMGFRVQVNTTVMAQNVEELADLAALLLEIGVPVWEVFFLIEVGRGEHVPGLDAAENEDVCHFLHEASAHGILVRTVEGPFFRRVVAQRRRLSAHGLPSESPVPGPLYRRLHDRLLRLLGQGREPRSQTVGTRDGMGVIFVGHDGRIRPSGFLPITLGDVRTESLGAVYRGHPLLNRIRQGQFSGRCGRCDFLGSCGGSRARAYAAGGDPLAEDPGCFYQPSRAA